MEKKTKEIMLNVRVEKGLKSAFIKHCKDNGYYISQRLRVLLKKDIDGK